MSVNAARCPVEILACCIVSRCSWFLLHSGLTKRPTATAPTDIGSIKSKATSGTLVQRCAGRERILFDE